MVNKNNKVISGSCMYMKKAENKNNALKLKSK